MEKMEILEECEDVEFASIQEKVEELDIGAEEDQEESSLETGDLNRLFDSSNKKESLQIS